MAGLAEWLPAGTPCGCVACGVYLRDASGNGAADGLGLLGCGHPHCQPCERMHPGVCGVCTPPQPWTAAELRDWYVEGSRKWLGAVLGTDRSRAGDRLADHYASSNGGGVTPHGIRYQWLGGKLHLWEPVTARGPLGTPPTLKLAPRELVRLVLAAERTAQAAHTAAQPKPVQPKPVQPEPAQPEPEAPSAPHQLALF